MKRLRFVKDDGGRAAAGFRGQADDCVTRSIAIATGVPYGDVYEDLNDRTRRLRLAGHRVGARAGVPRNVYQNYLFDLGWNWHPTMKIGSGCQVHLRDGELRGGRIIARCSGHLVAVIDGVMHDLSDPSRDGTRCVYGWFEPGVDACVPAGSCA